DMDLTGFETIPDIEAEEWQHDLPQIEAPAEADRVLEARSEPSGIELRVGQVVALGIARREERRVGRVPEPEGAKRQPFDREQRQRVLDVGQRLEVAAKLVVEPAAHGRTTREHLLLE